MAGGRYALNCSILFPGILINSVGQGMIVGLAVDYVSRYHSLSRPLGVRRKAYLPPANDFGVNLGLGIGGLITADSRSHRIRAQHQLKTPTFAMINLNYV